MRYGEPYLPTAEQIAEAAAVEKEKHLEMMRKRTTTNYSYKNPDGSPHAVRTSVRNGRVFFEAEQ